MGLVAHGCGGKENKYKKNGDFIERKYEKNKSLTSWERVFTEKDGCLLSHFTPYL